MNKKLDRGSSLVDAKVLKQAGGANGVAAPPAKDAFYSGKDFKSIVDNSPIGIFQFASGRLCVANQALARMFGYENPEELLHDRAAADLFGNETAQLEMIREAVESSQCLHREVECVRKDGATFTGVVHLCTVPGESGVIEGFVEDVSERRILEEQLREAQRAGAIGQLAGNVAHDFNNILSAIMMQLACLQKNSNLNADAGETLREVEAEAARATKLTRQLLSFSRRKAGRFAPLDLNQVVAGVMDMLQRLLGEDITIEFRPGTPSAWLNGDAGMMEHVVMNLCINARLTMPEGGRIVLGTSLTEFTGGQSGQDSNFRPGRFVCLSVADTGQGLDEAALQKMVQPASPVTEVVDRNELSLATVRAIVEQHQGWIAMQTRLDHGTTFQIFMPAVPEPSRPAETADAGEEPRGGTETILLVEDDHALRRSVALWLRKLGYAILEASNGVEAVKLWEQHRDQIDLLFSDLVMPESLSGLDLGERFSREKRSLKVLLSSGYGGGPLDVPLIGGREVAFLPKPYSAVNMARQVRHGLDAN